MNIIRISYISIVSTISAREVQARVIQEWMQKLKCSHMIGIGIFSYYNLDRDTLPDGISNLSLS